MATFNLIPSESTKGAYLRVPPETTAPMSGTTARSTLEAKIAQTLDDMVDEPDRARRKDLRHLIAALQVAILSLPSDQSQSEYGRFKRVRDAIKEYLTNVNRPVPMEQIVDALIDGGMRRKPKGNANATAEEIIKNTQTIIRKSVSFHLINERGIDAHVIKEANGKIGLWEWPDERFQ